MPSPPDKALCDWSKKELAEHWVDLRRIVERPQYACLKCGRAACEKKWLCKPRGV